MSDALANQLRLIRDACVCPEADTALGIVLAELIAEQATGLPAATIAEEFKRLNAVNALAIEERHSRQCQEQQEDSLNRAGLARFLHSAVPDKEAVEVVGSKTVSRGMSKKTVLVSVARGRSLPSSLVLRIDRSANNYLGTTVLDEYRVVTLLWEHGVRIPQPFALEPTGQVLGDPFIVFAKADGTAVGGNFAAPPPNPALVVDIAANLAKIHSVPTASWPRHDQPQGPMFIDQEIADYRADWASLNASSPITESCFDWIEANRARAYGPPALTHNDFNFNNFLVEGSVVNAVLDWEFAHVGTAAADLGYFYYSAEAVSSFRAFLAAYAAAGGNVPPDDQLDFYVLWGQLRLVVMCFKAVKSFEEGRFDDIRFGMTILHRRQALLRIAALLSRIDEGIV